MDSGGTRLTAEEHLRAYGVTGDVRHFNRTVSPELLDYLDLVEPRGKHPLLPHGVAENRGLPLLFFIDETSPATTPTTNSDRYEEELRNLRRVLASRGDRSYLARVLPGELRVVPVSLDQRTPQWEVYNEGTSRAATFFARLTEGRYDGPGEPRESDFVFSEMFKLLENAANQLASKLARADVLSLVGRALFFRFLFDRQVINSQDTPNISPTANNIENCFDSAEAAAATCRWLDVTFNGDFLPLPNAGNRSFFDAIDKKTNGEVFIHLGAIIRRGRPTTAVTYQLPLDWGDFDFAHVPVGLLSQVYEAFCWKWEHAAAKEASAYYTPRKIAATLVGEAFDSLTNASTARTLDPACGAGIFLVLAFRRLYYNRWKAAGERPDTQAIRAILYDQLRGFDISDSALKLSALSLYLTAIELDPEPIPPEKLRFDELRNRVLFDFRRPSDPKGMVIGSLGPHVGNKFDDQFDLILSNPPWTSIPPKQKELATEFEKCSREVISRKEETAAEKYHSPDNSPDLPFLWKSTEWCKADGRIAMALPARILLKQKEVPRHAREVLFRLLDITGIINGSNLSDTKVWPGMHQPFMLLFARNRRPSPNSMIRFITPYCEVDLNRRGDMRIDSESAHPIEVAAALDDPWLWKAISVGTSLDIDIIRRVRSANKSSLTQYWKGDLKLKSSTGYIVGADLKQDDASFLEGLPKFDSAVGCGFKVTTEGLEEFKRPTLHRPRKREVYEGPLALVKEAPGIDRNNVWALFCKESVAYDQSFYGYSAKGHPEDELLVRYLHLFVHSVVWLHYALITSPKFGAERRRFYKGDLDECPIVPFDRLTNAQKLKVNKLSQRLTKGDVDVFPDVDSFFADLYGLNGIDLEVINDTLEVCLPYDESRRRASDRTSSDECEIFRQRLQTLLTPVFHVMNKEPSVRLWQPPDSTLAEDAPFRLLLIEPADNPIEEPAEFLLSQVLALSNETGVTRVFLTLEDGLIVGILNQYRYWTPSRARLLAAEILRRHTTIFETQADVARVL
jgi:hypothetical protein